MKSQRTMADTNMSNARRAAFCRPPFDLLRWSRLMDAQVAEHLGLGLIDSQQIVASRQSWVMAVPFFGCVVAVVATEAARIAHVPECDGMGSQVTFIKGNTFWL